MYTIVCTSMMMMLMVMVDSKMMYDRVTSSKRGTRPVRQLDTLAASVASSCHHVV